MLKIRYKLQKCNEKFKKSSGFLDIHILIGSGKVSLLWQE